MDGHEVPVRHRHGRRAGRGPAVRFGVVLAVVVPVGVLTAVVVSVMAAAGVGQGWRQGFATMVIAVTLLGVALARRRRS